MESVLALIEAHTTELRAKGAQRIGVFGSFARGEATAESNRDAFLELSDKASQCR